MDLITIGVLGILVMLFLIVIGVPIAFSLAFIGGVGMVFVAGWPAALTQIMLIAWDKGMDFVMICVPMFIFMGQLVFHTKIAADLYDFLQKLMGRVPGGLAIASVGACGGFGAVTGSSVACVATMGAIIMPEMKKYKYDNKLATGVLAASGTLGILIPPSLGFVFYGILTDTSISALFMAGIIPGIITMLIFSVIIYIRCKINPNLAPLGPSYSWKERIISFKGVLPVLSIFVIVIGGLYGGLFTPTEASGVGVLGVFIISVIMKRLNWERFKAALDDTGVVSAMIFLLIIGGYLVSRFLAITQITTTIIDVIAIMELNKYVFLFLTVILYLILGCMLDVFGMIILTLPFLFPILLQYGFDPIWIGVFIVIMTEIALITPPIGVNVFIMHSVAKGVPMSHIFMGIIPFLIGELALVLLIIIVPEIATWLPAFAQ